MQRHVLCYLIALVVAFTFSPAMAVQARWQVITDREAGFTISFPGRPRYEQIPNRRHGFTSESYSFFYQDHDLRISFVSLNPPPRTTAETTNALNNSSVVYTAGRGRLLSQEKLHDGGRQYDNVFSDEGQLVHMRTRLYVRHGNLYTLSCVTYAANGIDRRVADQFFSSFGFLEDLPRHRPASP